MLAAPIAAAPMTTSIRLVHGRCGRIASFGDNATRRRAFLVLARPVENTDFIMRGGQALRQHRHLHQARGFIQAEHDIHALHALSRSTLHQVILHDQDNQQISAFRAVNRDAKLV